ncbi:DUF3576 domain-containing protein [Virgifigura deserti]|uniref:DUF3576 domain-containing protein n=1 Tax=Virgifigura deserti TaxID=2268457 RepID=UPI003CCC27B2
MAIGIVLAVAGCGYGEAKYPKARREGQATPQYEEPETLFGEGGLTFGGGGAAPSDDSGGGIGVNSFLWRASLDTVSFMPLVSADPFGGVIITDWYSPAGTTNERYKVNLFILGRALRADGIRASVFRQQLNGAAGWVDAPIDESTATKLENAILTRARQLRIAQAGQ